MEKMIEKIVYLNRHLNSIEHMILVSCRFTRTTEMLRRVMETIVSGYERFFLVGFDVVARDEEQKLDSLHHKLSVLSGFFEERGISVDLSDYFLLKKLLISDFESVGQYRKNLSMVSYVDGEEYVINMSKLHDLFGNLKMLCSHLPVMVNNGSCEREI